MASEFIQEEGWPQVHGETSSVKFTIQSGPIKEFGVNGCQIDDVIEWVKEKIEGSELPIRKRVSSWVLPKIMGISAESGGASGSKGSRVSVRPSLTGP